MRLREDYNDTSQEFIEAYSKVLIFLVTPQMHKKAAERNSKSLPLDMTNECRQTIKGIVETTWSERAGVAVDILDSLIKDFKNDH